MACYENGTVVTLAHREAITLPDVRGARLRVTQGTLWLTEEREHEDVVLRPGDHFVVKFDGNTVIEAQNDAEFCIVGRRGAAVPLPARESRRRRFLDAVVAFLRTPPRRHVPYA